MASVAHSSVALRSGFAGRRLAAPVNGRRTVMAKAGNWLPGSSHPAWLDGSLAGDYGFDPLGLGRVPSNLERFREAELINGRWAMLGVAGCLAVELFGQGDWFTAPLWAVTGGKPTWFGIEVPFNLVTLILVEFFLLAGAEMLRNEEKDPEKRCYPGGAFNPLGFAKDEASKNDLRTKEVKNGRLAMMAFLGFVAQHAATNKSPLANLADHLANPVGNNFAENGVSVPFL